MVQKERCAVAFGQLTDCGCEVVAVEETRQVQILYSTFEAGHGLVLFSRKNLLERDGNLLLPPEMHEHNVCRQAIEPGGECRFTPEGVNLAEQQKECLLG